MSVSRVKTWVDDEILTADDLIDFRIGGTDSVRFGYESVTNTGAVYLFDGRAITASASTSIARLRTGNTSAITIPAGTTAVVASAWFSEPNITATGTVTAAATVYIENAPTEGSSNCPLWVDDGNVRFDGNIELGHATDTTLSRSAAGKIAVEGIDVVLLSGAQTLSDKTFVAPILGAATGTSLTLSGNFLSTADGTSDAGTTTNRLANVYTDSIGDSGQALTAKSTSIVVGVVDTYLGIIQLAGGATGVGDDGGRLALYNHADYRSVFDTWVLSPEGDDFQIARSATDAPFRINGATGIVELLTGLTLAGGSTLAAYVVTTETPTITADVGTITTVSCVQKNIKIGSIVISLFKIT